jgi:hypothetical protein
MGQNVALPSKSPMHICANIVIKSNVFIRCKVLATELNLSSYFDTL